MLRIMLVSAALAVLPLSPQEAAMRSPSPLGSTSETPDAADRPQAMQGPSVDPVSVVGTFAPVVPDPVADSPAAARGRRTLSTAFVRVGPDGHLTVQLHGGRVLVLRDVVMNRQDYCGTRVPRGAGKARYCGHYADVAAARPGGAPVTDAPTTPDTDVIGPGAKRITK